MDSSSALLRRASKTLLTLGLCLSAFLATAYAGELSDLHREEHGQPTPGACETSAPANQLRLPGAVGDAAGCEEQRYEPRLVEVGLERTDCASGTCGVYTVRIDVTGRVHYLGVTNVDRIGTHVGSVDMALLLRVFAFAEEIDVFDYRATYASPFLDQPSTYVLVRTLDRRKVILDYGFAAPPEIWALEQLIDMLLDATVFPDPPR